jgi:acyltransferase
VPRIESTSRRSAVPDQLKALLLIVVIFGHTIPEGVDRSLTKWLIYGVHMPVFLFLSGYLITRERLLERTYPQFVRHYWRRMLLPWLLVSLVWGWTFGSFDRHRPLQAVLQLVLQPQWHLWYVPVLFAMLTLAWAAVRLRPAAIAPVLVGLGLVGVLVWGTPLGSDLVPGGIDGVADHRYFGYLIWFVLGLGLRNGWLRPPRPAARWSLVAIGAAGYLAGFWTSPWAAALGFSCLNVGLLLSLPVLLAGPWPAIPAIGRYLSFAGRHSLWIYLLHPFVTEPVRDLGLAAAVQRPLGILLTAAIIALVVALYRVSRPSMKNVVAASDPLRGSEAATTSCADAGGQLP